MSTSNPDRNQSLDEACAELHRMVNAFKARWLRYHAETPAHYPLSLSDGEWFENFLAEATCGEGLSEDSEPAR